MVLHGFQKWGGLKKFRRQYRKIFADTRFSGNLIMQYLSVAGDKKISGICVKIFFRHFLFVTFLKNPTNRKFFLHWQKSALLWRQNGRIRKSI
jgi:hypothetical protein